MCKNNQTIQLKFHKIKFFLSLKCSQPFSTIGSGKAQISMKKELERMYPRLGRHNSAAYWPLLPTPLFRLFRRERPFYCSLVLGSHVTTDDIWAPLKRRLVLLQTKWKVLLQTKLKVLLQTKWEVGTKPGFDQNLSRSLTTRSSRSGVFCFIKAFPPI